MRDRALLALGWASGGRRRSEIVALNIENLDLAAYAGQGLIQLLLRDAGLPQGFASPHGLRSGFLTQAARDGVPLQAAMRLTLHRSPQQAQKYYTDVEITDNPAADMFDKASEERKYDKGEPSSG